MNLKMKSAFFQSERSSNHHINESNNVRVPFWPIVLFSDEVARRRFLTFCHQAEL